MAVLTSKQSGALLITSSAVLILAMGLHPSGGSFQRLLRIGPVIIGSHAVAIATMPFFLAGYRGLRKQLGNDDTFSVTGFYAVGLALISGIVAAAINGLALPLFVKEYADSSSEIRQGLKPILKYGLSLNHSFDYLYMGGMCLATVLWSIAILQTKRLPSWLGYTGATVGGIGLLMLVAGFQLLNLHGFRLFVLGIIAWTILIGFSLWSGVRDQV